MTCDRRVWRGWWVRLWVTITLASASLTWAEPFVLHDGFEEARIAPGRWMGMATQGRQSLREMGRFIADGKLHLIAVGYGNNWLNRGREIGSVGLGVQTNRPVTALEAEMTVLTASVDPCPENANSTQGRAQLAGFFFNVGSPRVKGDQTGDYMAQLEKVADSRAGRFIRAQVLRCTSPSCARAKSIKALLFKQRWVLNKPDVLRIEWGQSQLHGPIQLKGPQST